MRTIFDDSFYAEQGINVRGDFYLTVTVRAARGWTTKVRTLRKAEAHAVELVSTGKIESVGISQRGAKVFTVLPKG